MNQDPTITTQALVSEIETFAERHNIAPATVTSRGAGNSRLYARMKRGGSCTLTIAARLRSYMRQRDAGRAKPSRAADHVADPAESAATPGGGA